MATGPGSPRLLIARLSHMGDCVTALPLLTAIRKAWPQAFIGWVAERPADQFLRDHPLLDFFLGLRRGWLKSPEQVLAVCRRLRGQRFQVTLDPQSLTRSAVIGWLSGARMRIGLARPHGREAAPWLHNVLVRPRHAHVVARTLDLLGPLGVSSPQAEFHYPQSPRAEDAMDAFLRRVGARDGFALINPGAGWTSRRWPAARYAEVARYLAAAHALPSVVAWAGPRERFWAGEICRAGGAGTVAAPPTDLMELAALLRRAAFYLGSDTGPMHVAVAVGTPCISLHGPTRPEESGPFGPMHIAIQRFFQDGTRRARRQGDNAAMRAIDAGLVCRACDEMLARIARRGAAAA